MNNQAAMVTDHDYCKKNLSGISWWRRAILWQALFIAHLLHFGQTRRSGDRYIEHPQAVANLAHVVSLSIWDQAAALLHDGIEENKGIKRLIAIILVLLTPFMVWIRVFALTNWYKNERRYFRQLLVLSVFVKNLLVLKLVDKKCVIGTPLHKSKEETIETLKEVLPEGAFFELIVQGRRYVSPEFLPKYDRLHQLVQEEALQQLQEALS